MKKLIIFFIIILLAIIACFKLFFDPIAKSFIEKNLSKDTGRIVVIQNIETDLFKGSIKFRNLQLKNDKVFSRENLLTIPLLEINFKFSEFFSKNIRFTKIVFHDSVVNYDVIIKDGKLVDSFYLVEQALQKENKNHINYNNNNKKEDSKKSSNKGLEIDFIINRLIIPKVTISAYAKDLEFEKNINIDQMIFDNVGNTEESNHYKDVMAMIVNNVAIKINNEVIINNLRKNFEKKIKELLKKNNVNSIIEKNSNKILNKLENLFK